MNIDDDRDSTIFHKSFISELGRVQARQSGEIGTSPLSSMVEHPLLERVNQAWDSRYELTKRIESWNDSIYQGGTAGINLLVPIWDEKVFLLKKMVILFNRKVMEDRKNGI
jgi:hypothetical protein